jgi:hypothetical protein
MARVRNTAVGLKSVTAADKVVLKVRRNKVCVSMWKERKRHFVVRDRRELQ